MDRQAVESSNIKSVGYESENQILEVKFTNGGVFQYEGVNPKEYVMLMNAPSVGKYLHSTIKPDHKCRKVEEANEGDN